MALASLITTSFWQIYFFISEQEFNFFISCKTACHTSFLSAHLSNNRTNYIIKSTNFISVKRYICLILINLNSILLFLWYTKRHKYLISCNHVLLASTKWLLTSISDINHFLTSSSTIYKQRKLSLQSPIYPYEL